MPFVVIKAEAVMVNGLNVDEVEDVLAVQAQEVARLRMQLQAAVTLLKERAEEPSTKAFLAMVER